MSSKASKKARVSRSLYEDWKFVDEVLACRAARTLYLWGAPGTGKTYSACRTGLFDREVYSITLTPETPAAELRGFWMPRGTEFVWMDGVFIEAMRKGARIVINERMPLVLTPSEHNVSYLTTKRDKMGHII